MKQAKFSITEEQIAFLEAYREHGFKDKSEVVRAAIETLRERLLNTDLDRSAELYAELYAGNEEEQGWVDDAARGWPE
jgi:Arc/MetJ-type ribon-helix-helix transcriptional regulator